MKKTFLICIPAILIFAIITILLWHDKMTSRDYFMSMASLGVFLVVAHSIDRLQELDLKNMRLVLREMKSARQDLHATREEVNRLCEELAHISLVVATESSSRALKPWEPMSAFFEREARRLAVQERISSILRVAGWENQRIAQVTASVRDLVRTNLVKSLASNIYTAACDLLHAKIKSQEIDEPEFHRLNHYASPDAIESAVAKSIHSEDAVTSFLQAEGIWDANIANLVQEFRTFIADQNL